MFISPEVASVAVFLFRLVVAGSRLPSNPNVLDCGGLPGYTGWKRCPIADANNVTCVLGADSANLSIPGLSLVDIDVMCSPTHARPLFDARAFGPAIVTPVETWGVEPNATFSSDGFRVTRTPGLFTATFCFKEPGLYQLEVIVEFANNWGLLNPEARCHLGVPVQGSPRELQVMKSPGHVPSSLPTEQLEGSLIAKPCKVGSSASAILDSQTDFPLNHGRWVFERCPERQKLPPFNISNFDPTWNYLDRTSFQWEYHGCLLAPVLRKVSQTNWSTCALEFQRRSQQSPSRQVDMYFLGDSVTRILAYHSAFHKSNMRPFVWGYFSLAGGVTLNLNRTIKIFRKMTAPAIVIVNSGLHDIGKYCDHVWARWRNGQGLLRHLKPESCVQTYQRSVRTMLQSLVAQNQHGINVFVTTTASWHKWGNVGPWLSSSRTQNQIAVREFNAAALEVLKEFPSVAVLDFFQTSIGRADNTERSAKGHFIHFDPTGQVNRLHGLLVKALILQQGCPNHHAELE